MKSAFLLGSVLALTACEGSEVRTPTSTPWLEPAAGVTNVSSGSSLERFFPLLDGRVYFYDTLNELNETGALVARVHRADATHGELRFPAGAKRFEYATDGIVLITATGTRYILKMPLQEGTSWPGEHGGTARILKTNASIEVPAGRYDGCIETLEEKKGDAPVRYATTFCPGVGVVHLEAATQGANFERADLKSYAEPEPIGPDGVSKMKVAPPPQ